MSIQKPKLITILGPTASGKSDLAVKLAKEFNGEIISADSRQIYKEMNIGTGKITKKEMKGIKHYLLDIATPKKQITITEFKEKAEKAIKEIYKKNKIPILCGGTGFYIQAITENIIIPRVKPDKNLRKELEKKTIKQLFEQLKKLDPKRSKSIDSKNKRRLIRALEILIKTKKPIPKLKKDSQFNNLYIGIKKENINELINKRVDKMIKQGLKKEVKALFKKYGKTQVLKNTIGYQEFQELNPIDKIKLHTRQFSKRQMTWFKKNPDIRWIKDYNEAKKIVKDFL
ncbi:tRNA (adenosine(37)-N6)-dimethylallyltransferase MiaA [Patescibacteria group bacterium]|nr:tRNA (adenosine(37)-N6)-dimethylallyltransferase MiaA [Patescibacteria group bacterium]